MARIINFFMYPIQMRLFPCISVNGKCCSEMAYISRILPLIYTCTKHSHWQYTIKSSTWSWYPTFERVSLSPSSWWVRTHNSFYEFLMMEAKTILKRRTVNPHWRGWSQDKISFSSVGIDSAVRCLLPTLEARVPSHARPLHEIFYGKSGAKALNISTSITLNWISVKSPYHAH
jgi:hypothetical protein